VKFRHAGACRHPDSLGEALRIAWIPASAGMTEEESTSSRRMQNPSA
jgi:hypothetical protein